MRITDEADYRVRCHQSDLDDFYRQHRLHLGTLDRSRDRKDQEVEMGDRRCSGHSNNRKPRMTRSQTELLKAYTLSLFAIIRSSAV